MFQRSRLLLPEPLTQHLQPLTANDSDVIVEELSDFGDTESLAISPGADLDLEPGLIEAEPLEMPLSAAKVNRPPWQTQVPARLLPSPNFPRPRVTKRA